MRISHKLVLAFVVVSLLVGIVGYLGLYANNKVVGSYESGEKHFSAIVEASNEISSYAKRAEGHAMLFLSLNNDADRKKFYLRVDALRNQTNIIDARVQNAAARKILDDIKARTDELYSVGDTLFREYDMHMNRSEAFDFKGHEAEVRKLDDVAAAIRTKGLELSTLEVALQASQQENSKKEAASLFNLILSISVFALLSAMALGYYISRSISVPVEKLVGQAREVGRGNFGIRTGICSKDEIGELALALNRMSDSLSGADSEIRKREDSLAASKKELERKIDELERFNRLTVGRELKMIDLKKKLKEKSSSKSKKSGG